MTSDDDSEAAAISGVGHFQGSLGSSGLFGFDVGLPVSLFGVVAGTAGVGVGVGSAGESGFVVDPGRHLGAGPLTTGTAGAAGRLGRADGVVVGSFSSEMETNTFGASSITV